MKIESIDLFYVGLKEIKPIPDGTQDSLLVRVRGKKQTFSLSTDVVQTTGEGTGGEEGWGECDSSPLVSIATYVMPLSHSNIISINQVCKLELFCLSTSDRV